MKHPFYNFFHKKISYNTFWYAISLIKHYKGKWTCKTKALYNEKTIISRLYQYFIIYFTTFICSNNSDPTSGDTIHMNFEILLFHLVAISSFLYQITKKSLNMYAIIIFKYMNTIVWIVRKLIINSLWTHTTISNILLDFFVNFVHSTPF